MNEQTNNRRGIFYGVIGVATLVVAIIGATFAYFTATAANNGTITGNMATISLSLEVDKVVTIDDTKGGMIPMANGMVEEAINNEENAVCVDDNGNAVCQIYKITLRNTSSAAVFVDGYVSLKGGSGTPVDYTSYGDGALFNTDGVLYDNENEEHVKTNFRGTTMRWAQVFEGNGTNAATGDYSTAGTLDLGPGDNDSVTFTSISDANDAKNVNNIRTENELATANAKGILQDLTISGSPYKVVGKNYVRVSNHTWSASGDETYRRSADATSALVYNHSIPADGTGEYYIVVWLSENGKNQNPGETEKGGTIVNPAAYHFFSGNVTFNSAQGSEVSASFTGYTRVTPTDNGA